MPKKPVLARIANGAVVCDEVRNEDNGKLLLIGVYSGDILVNEFPVRLGLTLYINFELPAGETEISVRLRSGNEQSVAFQINAVGAKFGTIGVAGPRLLVPIEMEGNLIIEAQFNNSGQWLPVSEKRILLKETFRREMEEFNS